VSTLRELIQQERFASPAQEAMLNVLVTYPWIMGELAAVMADFDVTPAQYNVLRILRGAYPERVACSYIGQRLLDPTPDVTRLLDRLEKAGLVDRRRGAARRRIVEVGINERGLERLAAMEAPVEHLIRHLMSRLDDAEQEQLSRLLDKLRSAAARVPDQS
jgi:DNA-binding MarR family transcriptional regulator